jgi:hypothetical protein
MKPRNQVLARTSRTASQYAGSSIELWPRSVAKPARNDDSAEDINDRCGLAAEGIIESEGQEHVLRRRYGDNFKSPAWLGLM